MVNPGRKHLTKSKLLVQEDMDVLSEIVDSSSLAVFNSTRALKPSDISNGRTTIPIIDTWYYVKKMDKLNREFDHLINLVP